MQGAQGGAARASSLANPRTFTWGKRGFTCVFYRGARGPRDYCGSDTFPHKETDARASKVRRMKKRVPGASRENLNTPQGISFHGEGGKTEGNTKIDK